MFTKPSLQSLLAMIFLLAAPISLCAQHGSSQIDQYGRWINGVSEPWWFPESMPKDDVKATQDRWSEIQKENQASPANEWAGDYFSGGDTHGTYVRWSQRNGFVSLHVDKCAAQVMGFSYGKVSATETQILFLPEKTVAASQRHNHKSNEAMGRKLLPAKWRGVPYLITEEEIRNFCDYLAGLGKFNRASSWMEYLPFLEKAGVKPTGTVDDPPALPPAFKRFIRRPIDATVVSIGARIVRRQKNQYDPEPHYESVTRVKISAGSLQGVKPSMAFYILESPGDELLIIQTGPRSSWGEVIRFVDDLPGVKPAAWVDAKGMEYPRLASGNRVTTSIHKQIALSSAKDPH